MFDVSSSGQEVSPSLAFVDTELVFDAERSL